MHRFGQSERNQIDDGSKEASITQALSLMNGVVEKSLIQNKSSVIQQALAGCKNDLEKIKKAYWLILCRLPSIDEYSMFRSLLSRNKKVGTDDLIWTLVNSHEFRFNE